MKRQYKIWVVCGLALLALSLWAYWSNRSGSAQKTATSEIGAANSAKANAPKGPGASAGPGAAGPIAVEIAAVKTVPLADDVTAVGSVLANESAMLRPEISGRIAQIYFRDGQRVGKGQLLISLDSSIPQAELRQAQAELELSRSNFKRSEELARQNFISERAKEEANANYKVVEARAVLAQTRLEKSSLRAPFAGTLGVRKIAVGDYIREGADLVLLEDTATVKIDFRLPERYVAQVKPGQRFTVETDSLPGKTFAAQVDLVAPQVDIADRTVLIRGKIPNPQSELKPGMFARVRLILSERPNVLVVPEEAIVAFADDGKPANFVYKVVGNKATRTRVETGVRRRAMVEIISGLQVGDQVVTAGQLKLRGREADVRIAKPGKPS